MYTTFGTYYSFLDDCLLSWLDWHQSKQDNSHLKRQSNQDKSHLQRIISTNFCIHTVYLLMMGLDKPETCRGWRNIRRISCASSWFFFTRSYRDALSTKHKTRIITSCMQYNSQRGAEIFGTSRDLTFSEKMKLRYYPFNQRLTIATYPLLWRLICSTPWNQNFFFNTFLILFFIISTIPSTCLLHSGFLTEIL